MPKTKSRTKKISRRQMVVLLGSGVVFSAVRKDGRLEAKNAEDTKEAKAAKTLESCHAVVPLVAKVNDTQSILLADPCCQEGLAVFRTGFRNIKDTGLKGHLKEFDAALAANESQLLEYCIMVWGLGQTERDGLVTQMRERYKLEEYPLKKK
jgi:hypothetical protein